MLLPTQEAASPHHLTYLKSRYASYHVSPPRHFSRLFGGEERLELVAYQRLPKTLTLHLVPAVLYSFFSLLVNLAFLFTISDLLPIRSITAQIRSCPCLTLAAKTKISLAIPWSIHLCGVSRVPLRPVFLQTRIIKQRLGR